MKYKVLFKSRVIVCRLHKELQSCKVNFSQFVLAKSELPESQIKFGNVCKECLSVLFLICPII